ncbi:MAG: hypothetical protein DI498_09370 [Paracoccus denitrificans]|nr:MAG: hypothetical protein DI498_09370 [Paracoccus denitrificans]PZO84082.1 MAG: hypothetical protein DI633_09370 [Paracoccus denitrificans]
MQNGRTEEIVDEVFQHFYAANVTYDLTRQWINQDGPFRYDLRWLEMNSSRGEQVEFMRRQFKSAFGVDPQDVQAFSLDDGVTEQLRTGRYDEGH